MEVESFILLGRGCQLLVVKLGAVHAVIGEYENALAAKTLRSEPA